MKQMLFAAALALGATGAIAEPVKYTLDPGHSQLVFSYNHLGYSTSYGMFAGFEGEIMFDADAPENSSVSVSIPVTSMITGWEKRFDHIMGSDFFDATDDEMITFDSTSIEVTGDKTANITGDLTINGETKPVVLETTLNQSADHPMSGNPTAGFSATTTIKRSDFGVGAMAPHVSDEVAVSISLEAVAAE